MDYNSETSWFSSLRRIRRRKGSCSSPHTDLPTNTESMFDIASNAVGGCNASDASGPVTQVSPRVAADKKSRWRDKFIKSMKVRDKIATPTTPSRSIEMLNSVCELKPVSSQFWSLPRRRNKCSTPTSQPPSRLRSHSSSTLVNNKRSTVWYHSPQQCIFKKDEVSFHGNAQIGYAVRLCRWMWCFQQQIFIYLFIYLYIHTHIHINTSTKEEHCIL